MARRRKTPTFCTAVGALVAATLGLQASPQEPPIPNLAGVYTGRKCVPGESAVCPELSRVGAAELLTARAMAFAGAFDELAAPKYDCGPATLPGLFGDPYAFRIEQAAADRVTLTYEKDDIVRTVWLEGHGHVPPPTGTFLVHGYSTGRYEGDELVVETTKFAFDPTGIAGDALSAPSSTQKRILERYSRRDGALRLQLTVSDPVFLRASIEYEMEWRASDQQLSLPWNCDPDAAQRNLRLVPTKYPQDPPVERRN